MKIEWVIEYNLHDKKDDYDRRAPVVPIVRVEALMAWLIEQRDKAGFYGKHEARGLLDIMLTNLKEQP